MVLWIWVSDATLTIVTALDSYLSQAVSFLRNLVKRVEFKSSINQTIQQLKCHREAGQIIHIREQLGSDNAPFVVVVFAANRARSSITSSMSSLVTAEHSM